VRPKNVKDRGDGVRTGELDDGTVITVRPMNEPSISILLLLQRHVLGISLMTPARQLAADVAPWGSPDGALNAGDLVVLQRHLMLVQ